MADQTNTSGGGPGIAFIVGALVVAVAVIGFFVFGGTIGDGKKDVDVKIEVPNPSGDKKQ